MQKWASDSTGFKFIFDGEALDVNKSPEDFDMEENDLVEVFYQ